MFTKYSRPLAFIFHSYKNHKILLIFVLLMEISNVIFSIVLPILAKMEMDQLAEKNEQLFGIIEASSFHIFIIILIIIFVWQLIQSLMTKTLHLLNENHLEMYKNELSKMLFERLKNAEAGIFLNARNKRFVGEILSSAENISNEIQDFITQFFTNSILLIGISSVLISIDWRMFLVLIITTISVYVLDIYRAILNEKRWLQIDYEYQYKIFNIRNEIRWNLTQIISSGGFIGMLERMHNLLEQKRMKWQKFRVKHFFIDIISFIFEHISEIVLKLIVWFSVFTATTSLGTMTMTLLYIEKLKDLFYYLKNVRFQYYNVIDDLARFDMFLDLTENKKEKVIHSCDFQTISFHNVGFHYPNFAKYEIRFLEIAERRIMRLSDKEEKNQELSMIQEARKELQHKPPQILKNINITFEMGKTYGLVGRNGAGKTTIISLLQGFFESYSGKIQYNNTEVKAFSRDFFEQNIAIINQIPYIIENATVRENILFGVKKSYSDEEIFILLEKFSIAEKIQKNMKWLDAEIGYDNDFSWWEKQILVLVRIILQDKKILIMDEGTNQLDAENEMIVMNELLKQKRDKIVIFITHRMTTIRKVDTIYCLKDGKIETFGTHNELIGKENMYNFFWKTQVEN